jgi:hypothetical protein
MYDNNCIIIRYRTILTCGNPPTRFGLSGHSQGRIQQRIIQQPLPEDGRKMTKHVGGLPHICKLLYRIIVPLQ